MERELQEAKIEETPGPEEEQAAKEEQQGASAPAESTVEKGEEGGR